MCLRAISCSSMFTAIPSGRDVQVVARFSRGCVLQASRGCVLQASRGCVLQASRGCVLQASRGCVLQASRGNFLPGASPGSLPRDDFASFEDLAAPDTPWLGAVE